MGRKLYRGGGLGAGTTGISAAPPGPEFIDEGTPAPHLTTPRVWRLVHPKFSALSTESSVLSTQGLSLFFIFSHLHGLWDLTSLTYGNPESKDISESSPLGRQGILSLHSVGTAGHVVL